MSETKKVYEAELEITDLSAEVVVYTHNCRVLPASYKSNHRMFRKKDQTKVTQVLISPNHIKLRVWTTVEAYIPELSEHLRAAAVRRITDMQTKTQRMYEQLARNVSRDIPVKHRGLGWRE